MTEVDASEEEKLDDLTGGELLENWFLLEIIVNIGGTYFCNFLYKGSYTVFKPTIDNIINAVPHKRLFKILAKILCEYYLLT